MTSPVTAASCPTTAFATSVRNARSDCRAAAPASAGGGVYVSAVVGSVTIGEPLSRGRPGRRPGAPAPSRPPEPHRTGAPRHEPRDARTWTRLLQQPRREQHPEATRPGGATDRVSLSAGSRPPGRGLWRGEGAANGLQSLLRRVRRRATAPLPRGRAALPARAQRDRLPGRPGAPPTSDPTAAGW